MGTQRLLRDQEPPKRYGIIDMRELGALCGFAEVADFQRAHSQWVEEALTRELVVRDDRWSEAIAVGSLGFVESVKSELGNKALHRGVEQIGERMRCGNEVRLTTAVYAAKVSR
jgi:hypothetical protein